MCEARVAMRKLCPTHRVRGLAGPSASLSGRPDPQSSTSTDWGFQEVPHQPPVRGVTSPRGAGAAHSAGGGRARNRDLGSRGHARACRARDPAVPNLHSSPRSAPWAAPGSTRHFLTCLSPLSLSVPDTHTGSPQAWPRAWHVTGVTAEKRKASSGSRAGAGALAASHQVKALQAKQQAAWRASRQHPGSKPGWTERVNAACCQASSGRTAAGLGA